MHKEFTSQVPVGSITPSQELRGLTPAERAIEQLQNVKHLKMLTNKPVNVRNEGNITYYDFGESADSETQSVLPNGVIFKDPTSLDEANSRMGNDPLPKKQKQKKPLKTHDTKGLDGFWKGQFYRDGIPQKHKGKRRK